MKVDLRVIKLFCQTHECQACPFEIHEDMRCSMKTDIDQLDVKVIETAYKQIALSNAAKIIDKEYSK